MNKINSKEEIIKEIKLLHNKLGRRPKRDDNVQLNSIARKFFGGWTNALEKAGYEVKRIQKPKIPFKLTPGLCYFIGLLITDGHLFEDIKRRHYGLQLFTSYEKERDLIICLVKELFDYRVYVRTRKFGFNKRDNYEIHINSKELLYYFKNNIGLLTGAKSKTIRIPEFFFDLDKELIGNFIRGVIDGDGNVSLNKPMGVSSGSYGFLQDLKRLFLKINIRTSEIKQDKTCYDLRLYQKDNLEIYGLLYENINLCYSRKKEILETNIFKNRSYY